MRLTALPLLLAACPALGCINTDAAIFVAPSIESPAATVASVALGTTLSGTFTLDLHLGARAGGPSTVTLGQFSIQDTSQTTTIVPELVVTSDVTFPTTIQPGGSDVVAHLTFSTGNGTLASTVKSQLCTGSDVVISGVVEDSLAGRSDPVTSPGFQPTCM